MTELPKRPYTHQIASEAVLRVKNIIPTSWNIIEYPNQNDYGIDIRVEIFEMDVSTGDEFNIQIKGHSSLSKTSNIMWPVSNLLYLWENKLPSVLIVYLKDKKILYMKWLHKIIHNIIDRRHKDKLGKYININFTENDIINEDTFQNFIKIGLLEFEKDFFHKVFRLCYYPDTYDLLMKISDSKGELELSLEIMLYKYGNAFNLLTHEAVLEFYPMYDKVKVKPESKQWKTYLRFSSEGEKIFQYYINHKNIIDDLREKIRGIWACAG